MRVLIVDDEENIRKTTSAALEDLGYETVGVGDGTAARAQLEKGRFDAAFLDLKLNGESGLKVLPEMLKSDPQLSIVVFTAYASIENAVEAMRCGAVDYLAKPFLPAQIKQVLDRIIKARRLQGRLAELESRISSDLPAEDLSTEEPEMRDVYQLAFKAAATSVTIILLGESGTGKSVLARALHARSAQKENTFVTVSCPSLSKELLESELFGHVKGAFTGAIGETWGKVALAEGGTLYLDEIGDLPLEIQPRLLRLLQEKEYERVGEPKPRRANVRVIAATNANLAQAVKEGQFREDLYYRLNVLSIRILPLRERKKDLMRIASNYLRFFCVQCGKKIEGFSPAAEEAMLRYSWPGNLRELRNLMERAVILTTSSRIEPGDLTDQLRQPIEAGGQTLQLGAKVPIQTIENEHIRQILRQTNNMEEAANILGINLATLYRKRKQFSL